MGAHDTATTADPKAMQRGRCGRSATTTGSPRETGLGASARCSSGRAGSAPGSACSTSRPGQATSRSGRRSGARRRRLGPHARELRGRPPRGGRRGVELDWVEADAESLPFGDAEFDVVTSCFGAMFAPDHEAVAERARARLPPGWHDRARELHARGHGRRRSSRRSRATRRRRRQAHSRRSSGATRSTSASSSATASTSLEMTRRTYTERASEPGGLPRLFEDTFGPLIALRAALADRPRPRRRLDRDFADFTERANEGPRRRPGRVRLRVPPRRGPHAGIAHDRRAHAMMAACRRLVASTAPLRTTASRS